MLQQQSLSEKAILVVLIWTLISTSLPPSVARPKSSKLVDLALLNEEGKKVSLAEAAAHRPTLLYFWATWCKPCRAMQKKVSAFALRNKGLVQVLGINVGGVDSLEDIKTYRHRYGISYTLLLDRKNKAIEVYGIIGIPAFILFNGKGEIRYRGNAPPASLDDLK